MLKFQGVRSAAIIFAPEFGQGARWRRSIGRRAGALHRRSGPPPPHCVDRAGARRPAPAPRPGLGRRCFPFRRDRAAGRVRTALQERRFLAPRRPYSTMTACRLRLPRMLLPGRSPPLHRLEPRILGFGCRRALSATELKRPYPRSRLATPSLGRMSQPGFYSIKRPRLVHSREITSAC